MAKNKIHDPIYVGIFVNQAVDVIEKRATGELLSM